MGQDTNSERNYGQHKVRLNNSKFESYSVGLSQRIGRQFNGIFMNATYVSDSMIVLQSGAKVISK